MNFKGELEAIPKRHKSLVSQSHHHQVRLGVSLPPSESNRSTDDSPHTAIGGIVIGSLLMAFPRSSTQIRSCELNNIDYCLPRRPHRAGVALKCSKFLDTERLPFYACLTFFCVQRAQCHLSAEERETVKAEST